MTGSRIPYPWLSTTSALLIICWQFILLLPGLILPYELPAPLTQEQSLLAGFAITILFVVFDVSRFVKAWGGYKAQLLKRENQITELFDSRRELGARVRTYSDHADKLKLFISDRLLEYIEYDEKFLHFKNIASEVRHNGVISYDRAQTALKMAAELCANKIDEGDEARQFEEASESLLYLWDLLDIATTDNITLHVAKRIYDSEEYYFQSMLNKKEESEFPYSPTFSMFSALRKALWPVTESPQHPGYDALPDLPFEYHDERFHLLVRDDCDMLGNRNHMVLLLENLLNNAVYYADQKTSKSKYSRIAILLVRQQDQIVLNIYNRGPRIKEEDRNRIFQLGYSSRRVRDHHGKGLGLYFVNEICKGFEG
ncbi:MAG: sensor histidine kinase, partial [Gammaproteobacteria bacterium]|nr:sensor histidine kinase [Gammaproteobacteria bacterium]